MERKAWLVVTAVLVGIIILLGAGFVWIRDANDPGRWDEMLLGPVSERRQFEMAREGFALDLPADWQINTTPAQDREQIERTGLRPVLVADPPDIGSTCTVYVATGDAPTASGCFPRDADEPWGEDAWDRADVVIGPLTGEYECAPGWGIGTLRQGGPVSLSFRQPSGVVFTAYHFDAADRDYVLACALTPWLPDGSRSEVPWPCEPFDANWAIQPIADTFEILPAE
jgi:hypothetical protein